MLINIQFLRFAAAMLVVLFHCADHLRAAGQPLGWLFGFGRSAGFAGVDIFFVISGFIMVWTTRTASGAGAAFDFARRRIARIYSGYWPFYLLAFLLFSVLGGRYLANVDLLGSFWLWPTELGRLLIPVSWTLIFEMGFYLLFALLMLFAPARRARLLWLLMAATLAWTLYSQFVRRAYEPGVLENMNVYEQYLAFPYLLEFLGGALLALRLQARPAGPAWSPLLAGIALFLLAGWANEQYFGGRLLQGYYVSWRVLLFGTAAMFLLAGAVRLETGGRTAQRRFSLAAGGASYALYLGHTLVLAATHALGLNAFLSQQAGWAAQVAFAALALAMLGASVAHYRWVERPLHRGFRRLLGA